MAILINNKALFIHFPKTGGVFVHSFFERFLNVKTEVIGNQHDILPIIKGKITKKVFKFSILRHPLTWWESYWNWKNKDWDHPEGGPNYRYIPTWDLYNYKADHIDDFIENVYKDKPKFLTEAWKPYEQSVDKIYLFEDFNQTIKNIAGKIKKEVSIEDVKNYGKIHKSNYFERIQRQSTKDLILSQENEIISRYYREPVSN